MKVSATKRDLLVGTWSSAGKIGSDVVYRVVRKKGGLSVVASDFSDGERADAFEEKWDPLAGASSFATYWNSTGRFTRCKLQAITTKQVQLTFTYTDTDVLVRAPGKGKYARQH
jgi:hypothetical protein